MTDNSSILSSSALMAAGTAISRLSGFVRSALLAAALGTQLHADVFTIANTVPNMLYILLAGGVFNTVLVPQLVRAMRNHPDGGDAYTNRIVTLAGLFLAGTTALLVLGAPLLMRLFLDDAFFTDALALQRESVIDFARLALPQVFFYGMFVLVGQILNARGRFGPMMWAPIANNLISVTVLGLYLFIHGAARGDELCGGYTTGQEWLLGLGSTLGIAAQLLILLPYLRAAGFRFRPRFDFRGTGLGHTFRLGLWTLGLVVVSQLSYTVVVRLASSGTAEAAAACGAGGGEAGTGYTIYSGAFLLMMVPHSIATVSLATATLPRLSAFAADGDLRGVARQVAATTRAALALIIPFAMLLPVVALPLSQIVWGYAAAADTAEDFVPSLVLFAPGLVFYTVHYLIVRGYHALERTRTVFWVQCVIAAINVTLAVLVTSQVEPEHTAPGLAVAYSGAYAAGALVSYLLLRQVLGGLETRQLARFLVRTVLAAGAGAAAAMGTRAALLAVWDTDDSKLQALTLLAAATVVDVVVYLLVARLLRVAEVSELIGLVSSRLGR